MKTLWMFMLMAVVGFCFATAQTQASPASDADRNQIIQLERDWTQSFISMDVAANERILADDFFGTEPTGRRVTKGDIIAEVKTGEPLLSGHLNEDDVTIRFYGGTAVVNGSSMWKRKSDGKKGRYIWTDVFVKRKGQWQIVASQDLEVADKP
ncbi:MAG: nuclear transport factor 2 family protein [Terriglobales bacterium]